MCCFLNFYGWPYNTVIILVKKHQFYECERLVLVFRSCNYLIAFGHSTCFWCPTNVECIQNTQQKKSSLLLCNDCVFLHNFLRFWPNPIAPNSCWLLSILQLKINELPDYRVCGQSSSNHCISFVCVYRMKFYTFAIRSSLEQNFFCGVWLQFFWSFWFT